MARPLRIEFPGATYHVSSRTSATLPVFKDNADMETFLSGLAETVSRYHWICHAYCLMEDHYQLILETPVANLSLGMRQVNGIYTQAFNRKYGHSGQIFKGRFKSVLMDRETYLLEMCRHVVLAPIRENLADHPREYPWSSYLDTAGPRKAPPFLTTDWILSQFSTNDRISRARYKSFISDGVDKESPLAMVTRQCLLGGPEFIESLTPYLRLKGEPEAFASPNKNTYKPPLKGLFPTYVLKSRKDRDKAIYEAHIEHGYTQQEIASHLELHYSWVSRIIKQQSKAAMDAQRAKD